MRDHLLCVKDDFIAIGGYDERFDLYYGPEDRDLQRQA